MLHRLRQRWLLCAAVLSLPILLGAFTLLHAIEDHGEDCVACRALDSGGATVPESICRPFAPTSQLCAQTLSVEDARAGQHSSATPRGPPCV